MARANGNKPEDQEQKPTGEQQNEQQGEVLSPPVEVVLLKNIRHTTGVRRKGEKLAVTEEESQQLINAKLARLPE